MKRPMVLLLKLSAIGFHSNTAKWLHSLIHKASINKTQARREGGAVGALAPPPPPADC